MNKPIHVAVGVIQDPEGRILIARRPAHLHQGGLWEFPGGKLEPEENVIGALRRELREELGLEIQKTEPLIRIQHDYGDKLVLLDVHRVIEFSGVAHGREGQALIWITIDDIINFDFPAANRGIIQALRLPDRYAITGNFHSREDYLARFDLAVEKGIQLFQLRAPVLRDADYLELANAVSHHLPDSVCLVLNTSPELHARAGIEGAGLHLNSRRLMQLQVRPVPEDVLLSTSVHNQEELVRANRIGADLLLISPVRETASHPGQACLGWEGFAQLTAAAKCPVYALGGMQEQDIQNAVKHGGHGIAAISALWTAVSDC